MVKHNLVYIRTIISSINWGVRNLFPVYGRGSIRIYSLMPFCEYRTKKESSRGLGVRAVVQELPPQPQDAGKVEINVKK